MKNTNKILLIVIIVLVVALLAIVLYNKQFSEPDFYAVYLRTGDLYFGQLVRFPSFGLRQVYTIQVDSQNQETPFSIQKFANVFWGPEDYLKINREQVVWIIKLDANGQLAQLIKSNPSLAPSSPEQ